MGTWEFGRPESHEHRDRAGGGGPVPAAPGSGRPAGSQLQGCSSSKTQQNFLHKLNCSELQGHAQYAHQDAVSPERLHPLFQGALDRSKLCSKLLGHVSQTFVPGGTAFAGVLCTFITYLFFPHFKRGNIHNRASTIFS